MSHRFSNCYFEIRGSAQIPQSGTAPDDSAGCGCDGLMCREVWAAAVPYRAAWYAQCKLQIFIWNRKRLPVLMALAAVLIAVSGGRSSHQYLCATAHVRPFEIPKVSRLHAGSADTLQTGPAAAVTGHRASSQVSRTRHPGGASWRGVPVPVPSLSAR